jgi:D-proline reductase (dithiol) PrdB
MGDVSEFSMPLRLFLKAYRWRCIDPVPWTPLRKALSQCRMALVSSAGFVLPGQPPFDETIKAGDPSFREIASNTDPSTLIETHRSGSFDRAGLQADPNLAFPIDRVNELAALGRIGSVNHRHLSFMGSIVAPAKFERETLPPAAQKLVDDQVDVALLVPV